MAGRSMGQFIAVLRKAKGMTQQEVADRLNVSNKAVSRWERDECVPDLSLIPALAELFEVTCDELLKGERILGTSQPEGTPRLEKQRRTVINRAISDFKTLIWISLALSAVGLICMFGISYGFYRPVIGFAVMFLFTVAAVTVAAIATNRMREMKTDNELLENAEGALLDKFDRNLGSFSFAAFFAALAVILFSAPLAIDYDSIYLHIDGVLTARSYFFWFFGTVSLILLAVFFAGKDRYIAWTTQRPYQRRGGETDVHVRRMTLWQSGTVTLAGIAFLIAPYFDQPYSAAPVCIAINILGLALLAANIGCFIVFMIRRKEERKKLILPGIRNMLMVVSGFLFTEIHVVGFISYGKDVWERSDSWQFQYLCYSMWFALIVGAIFKGIQLYLNKKKASA